MDHYSESKGANASFLNERSHIHTPFFPDPSRAVTEKGEFFLIHPVSAVSRGLPFNLLSRLSHALCLIPRQGKYVMGSLETRR